MKHAVTLGVVLLVLPAGQQADFARQEARAILVRQGFGEADLARLEAGEVIAQSDTLDDGEIVTTGAVKVNASRERVLRYYGQLASYVDGEVTLAFGRFSDPPALGDVAGLAFDPDEIEELRTCRIGDCDIKLSGSALTSLRETIDWSAPDHADAVNDLVRRRAIDYVNDYRTRGDAALIVFNDDDEPVSVREHWLDLLSEATVYAEYVPELIEYLRSYPAARPDGARDLFYWAKGDYGLKPVISLVHTVIYSAPSRPDRDIVVQKFIYASHYFDASVASATLLSAGPATTYVLYGNRSKGDLLRGGLGMAKRAVARSQATKATESTLRAIKTVLERNPGR